MHIVPTSPLVPPAPLDLRLAFISSYPPRRCGIGTYAKDLATGINNLNPERLVEIITLVDPLSEELQYPWEVSHRIRQHEWSDYERVLDYLNKSIIDMVLIQHEFGLFGGPDGEFIVDFVKKLKKPFVLTIHSTLQHPNPNQKRIMQEIARKASGVVVMLSSAGDILRRVYGIPKEKIVPIHHGAPDFPFFDSGEAKQQLELEDRIVMSSINLLGEGRGIEYAIQALPPIVAKYPNFLYLIVGQTHPVVLKQQGEAYRNKLEQLVKDLKLEKNVQFVNEYVPLDDLIRYVKASDFYITPYEDMQAASSGSLAYAIAAGKPCIATPYRYAKEMLMGGRGYLVEPRDPESITQALLHGIMNPKEVMRIRQKCYALGRTMTWARVAFCYTRMFDYLLRDIPEHERYPKPTLDYLHFLTRDIGLSEHSNGNRLNLKEGYAADDNARGLMVAIKYGDKRLADKYLDFLIHSEKDGQIFCDVDSRGRPVGEAKMGDWYGRTFWAAAYAMRYGQTATLRTKATDLVRKLLPSGQEIRAIRTYAYVLLGLMLLKELEWDEFIDEREQIIASALAAVNQGLAEHEDASWHWPEPALTYDNARLPHALLEIARVYEREDMKTLGLRLLDFVIDHTFDIRENHFRFIGNKGWLPRGGERTYFDEQPIEAGATVQACYSAYLVTRSDYYRDMAKKAFTWYHGDNILRRPLFNTLRQSVYDGIMPDRLNPNQGAESILEYLLAYTCYAKLVEEGLKQRDLTYSAASHRAAPTAA